MKSAGLGKRTSAVEVTNVSDLGFWLLIEGRETFVGFDNVPWFREASIGELCQVELQSPRHLYWPDLDVDLAIESLSHPERFPFVSAQKSKRLQPALSPRLARRRRG